MIGWRVRLGRKHGDRGCRGRGGLFDPLRKGIARAPVVLAIEEKTLAMEAVGAALGFDIHASAGCARAFGIGITGDRLHRAHGGLADREISPTGPRLSHAVRLVHTLS